MKTENAKGTAIAFFWSLFFDFNLLGYKPSAYNYSLNTLQSFKAYKRQFTVSSR